MSLDAGGGGAGATKDARSRGVSAELGGARGEGIGVRSPGGRGERPGGGRGQKEGGERKVRRGLERTGVPSSSSVVGGGGAQGGRLLEEVEERVPVAAML